MATTTRLSEPARERSESLILMLCVFFYPIKVEELKAVQAQVAKNNLKTSGHETRDLSTNSAGALLAHHGDFSFEKC